MYDFHYNLVKKKFDAKLLFTHTVLLMKQNQKMFMKKFLNNIFF